MQPQAVDLSAIAQAIAVELSQTQPERPVEFIIASGGLAQGNFRLLRVVLENLLTQRLEIYFYQANARYRV
jgi:hypothetical protein